MNKECNFELESIYIDTYEDNGAIACYKCKHYDTCKKLQIEKEMEAILIDLNIKN